MRLFALLCLLAAVSARTTAEKEEAQKAIRMKTTRQLKEIFDGAGLEYSGLDKEGLQKLAYKNYDALKDKLERKKRPSSGGGGGGGGFGGDGKNRRESSARFGGGVPFGRVSEPWRRLRGPGAFGRLPPPSGPFGPFG